ncbi:hypothetical protein ASE95_08785 [Sphingomonas sp. Leaf231]|uniref:hypothetical protein n=1 Tax=Sphingomonas sp. Leaf231 TaxID=1736301 RepID=UPI0006FC7D0A|nr:hypothetical protein [Sphingomonas sp. Leaf231]KQN92747.1 hypothetical protein ASE95_08785 [Sphingomonas sp. Leaf231]
MSGAVMAAMIAKARNRVSWYFTSAGATSKATATRYETPDARLDRRVFKRMLAFGAIEKTPDGLYWLNEERLADYRKESLARVLGILAIAGFAAAGAMAIGG